MQNLGSSTLREADTEMVTNAFRGETRWDRALRSKLMGLIRRV
jgi:hypothetical protein